MKRQSPPCPPDGLLQRPLSWLERKSSWTSREFVSSTKLQRKSPNVETIESSPPCNKRHIELGYVSTTSPPTSSSSSSACGRWRVVCDKSSSSVEHVLPVSWRRYAGRHLRIIWDDVLDFLDAFAVFAHLPVAARRPFCGRPVRNAVSGRRVEAEQLSAHSRVFLQSGKRPPVSSDSGSRDRAEQEFRIQNDRSDWEDNKMKQDKHQLVRAPSSALGHCETYETRARSPISAALLI